MKSIFRIFFFTILMFGLTSCLKDDLVEDQKYGMINLDANKIIELPYQSHTNSIAMNLEDELKTVDLITVRLAASETAPEDITVDLAMDNTMIEKYNSSHDTEYEELVSSLYQLPSSGLKVTIPKGSRTGVLQVKINPTNLDPAVTYAAGFYVSSVSKPEYKISGNFDSLLVVVGVKNKFDGIYEIDEATSSIVDANGAYTDDYPREIELTSVNANSVIYYDLSYDYPNLIVNSIATGGAANSGIRPIFVFDLNSNEITSVRDANNATRVFTSVEGHFNPDDRSIYVKYVTGRWTVTENYKFEKER